MKRTHFLSLSFVVTSIFALSACGPRLSSIEVLPPRTAPSCASPSAKSPSAARGLLDLEATQALNGAYVADLRISGQGGDIRVNGLKLSYKLPSGASSDVTNAANDAGEKQRMGELFMQTDADAVGNAVLEKVVLLPRALAAALRNDSNLNITAITYETIVVEIEAMLDDEVYPEIKGSFAIDLCENCLVEEPSEETCPHGIQETGTCRPGQDAILYECAAAPASISFP